MSKFNIINNYKLTIKLCNVYTNSVYLRFMNKLLIKNLLAETMYMILV